MPYQSGFIAIIGRPNVGKSTLLNHLLGQKISIISDKPQTTRNKILGVKQLPDCQMVFLDTPGIDHAHRSISHLNTRMTQTTFNALHEVDLILFVVEQQWNRDDQWILDGIKNVATPKVLVFNKIDIVSKTELISVLSMMGQKGDEMQHRFSDIIPISAKTGENTEELIKVARTYLKEGDPYFPEDQITDQPVRFLAAEMIREAVIERTKKELPHVVTVQIDTFREDEEKNLIKIQSTIFVEKESQKGILIGKDGERLKAIGQAARCQIEQLLDAKVFLQMWVKVKKDWRKNDFFLDEMGY